MKTAVINRGQALRMRAVLAGLSLLALAACDPSSQPPSINAEPPTLPAQTEPSAQSAAVKTYMARVQADLLAQGMLRTDGGGPDTPFNDRMLAENFIKIALFDEYTRSDTGFIPQESASRLRRWQAPVRVGLNFGASVSPQRQATDRARIGSYLARLSRLTGHPISLATSGANFQIYIVNEDERRALGPVLQADLPGMKPADLSGLTNMRQSDYCIVYALSAGQSSVYSHAVAVLRAENPDLLSLVCIHEEIAQGLGLANDSQRARPSIFNDDQEFALLTRQDELMLKMLYDPRLRPGMKVSEARPVVEALAKELTGGES